MDACVCMDACADVHTTYLDTCIAYTSGSQPFQKLRATYKFCVTVANRH